MPAPDSVPVSEEELDLAQEKLTRVLDDQLQDARDTRSSMNGVLGFVIATIGIVLSLGHSVVAANLAVGLAAVGLLLMSAIVLAIGFTLFVHYDAPNPSVLLMKLGSSSAVQLKREIVSNLAGAFVANQLRTSLQMSYLKIALALLMFGLVLLVANVMFPGVLR